jgi:hypothetical protein
MAARSLPEPTDEIFLSNSEIMLTGLLEGFTVIFMQRDFAIEQRHSKESPEGKSFGDSLSCAKGARRVRAGAATWEWPPLRIEADL